MDSANDVTGIKITHDVGGNPDLVSVTDEFTGILNFQLTGGQKLLVEATAGTVIEAGGVNDGTLGTPTVTGSLHTSRQRGEPFRRLSPATAN